MIRPLRQRHRWMVFTLGVTLPLVFEGGIAARRPVPSVASLPAGSQSFLRESAAEVWNRSDLFVKAAVQVRLLRESSAVRRYALDLSAGRDFVKPDLLVYWVSGNSKITEILPENALLLGTFSATTLSLPPNAMTESGMLVLYSLANNEIVDVSKALQFGNSGN